MPKGEKDRLILDRDVPGEIARLGIESNAVDLEEVIGFTLEADLERLSELMKEGKNRPRVDQEATHTEIRRRMKQAEENRDKLSERGIVAFTYLQSTIEIWNK